MNLNYLLGTKPAMRQEKTGVDGNPIAQQLDYWFVCGAQVDGLRHIDTVDIADGRTTLAMGVPRLCGFALIAEHNKLVASVEHLNA